MCLLSHCHHIEGSFYSSYSRVALMLNLIRRKQLEKADYELNKYVFRKPGLWNFLYKEKIIYYKKCLGKLHGI
jgi:ribosomal protein L16/L10AE